MGNNGSFMEKVYLYLPVLMCHSRMDYNDSTTMWNIRVAYFAEQVVVFSLSVFFIVAITRQADQRRIFVPDVSFGQLMTNNVPTPEQMRYRQSTYFHHETAEAFQQLQQNFVAFMLTMMAHFMLDFRPILLLQLFSTPYHYTENRLLRKYILGLKPGSRIWGERFEGELGKETITPTKADRVVQDGDDDVVGSGDGGGGRGKGKGSAGTPVGGTTSVPVEGARVDESAGEPVAKPSPGGLLMPKSLENALIDAWDAVDQANWSTVYAELGPFSINTQTPSGGWTALMVACGLPKVGEEEIKTLISDFDARVDIQDEDGWTCAHWAAQQGRAEALCAVFEGMRESVSDPSEAASSVAALLLIADNNGKSAADVARDAGLEEGVLENFLALLKAQDDTSLEALD